MEIYQLKNFKINLKNIDKKLDYKKCCEELVSRGLDNTKKENLKYTGGNLLTKKTSLRKYSLPTSI